MMREECTDSGKEMTRLIPRIGHENFDKNDFECSLISNEESLQSNQDIWEIHLGDEDFELCSHSPFGSAGPHGSAY